MHGALFDLNLHSIFETQFSTTRAELHVSIWRKFNHALTNHIISFEGSVCKVALGQIFSSVRKRPTVILRAARLLSDVDFWWVSCLSDTISSFKSCLNMNLLSMIHKNSMSSIKFEMSEAFNSVTFPIWRRISSMRVAPISCSVVFMNWKIQILFTDMICNNHGIQHAYPSGPNQFWQKIHN